MRKILDPNQATEAAQKAIDQYFPKVIVEIEDAIKNHEWVLLGVAQNPFVKRARNLLNEAQIKFHYIEHGSYFSGWKLRLAIKLWSGWPTFPQVFHKGKLVGGFNDLSVYLKEVKARP